MTLPMALAAHTRARGCVLHDTENGPRKRRPRPIGRAREATG